jgi:hypothetical protein
MNSMKEMRDSDDAARTGFCLSTGGILYPRLYRRHRTDKPALKGLDPGIAEYVNALREAGVETFESCEGSQGHPYSEPTVRFFGQREEGFRALAIALERGFPVDAIRRFWDIIDGEPSGPYWEMTFRC